MNVLQIDKIRAISEVRFVRKRCYTTAEGRHILDAMMQAHISPLLLSNERESPSEIQVEAFLKGLIPYIPDK